MKKFKSKSATVVPSEPISLKSTLIALLVTAVVGFIAFYIMLPVINPHDTEFWMYLLGLAVVFLIARRGPAVLKGNATTVLEDKRGVGVIVGIIVVFVLCSLSGAKFFHAKAYSNIITVDENAGIENIPSVEGTDAIALMDTQSAEKMGDREIGSLTEVVSQYDVGSYVQINYKDRPMKVAPLRYSGFFKWLGNRNVGVPGYVIVDPVKMDADYVALENKMKYVPSAYFNDNLERRLRFAYPTMIFRDLHIEIDEDGKPFYVAPVYKMTIGVFGGETVKGAVIADPASGEMNYYEVGDIPIWADFIYSGDLICTQYNYHAQLHNGFWNSLIGQKGCKKTTDFDEIDFGYIAMEGDIWVYTGVTSVNGDSSNLGFLISNERTEETKFIACAGADEGSAMGAAEGEVQEKRYKASFPSLINVDGVPTYIMVLKDANGIVKMYACVNVSQYNQVVTATRQNDCIEKYRQLVGGEITQEEANANAESSSASVVDTSSYEAKTIQVVRLEKIDKDGNTYLYILDEDGNIYSARYADVLAMLTVQEGDEITIMTDGKGYTYGE